MFNKSNDRLLPVSSAQSARLIRLFLLLDDNNIGAEKSPETRSPSSALSAAAERVRKEFKADRFVVVVVEP